MRRLTLFDVVLRIVVFGLPAAAVCVWLIVTFAADNEASAQWPAPSSEPPITWNPATDTLTVTRGDVMLCIPQQGKPPACRFAKWWTEKEIR